MKPTSDPLRLLWVGLMVLALLMLGLHFWARSVGAQEARPPAQAEFLDCKVFGAFAHRVALMRTVEARLELVIREIRRELKDAPVFRTQAYVREAARVYAEGHPPTEAEFQAFRRCTETLGRVGPEA